MHQRGFLLSLAVTALVSLFMALSLHQTLEQRKADVKRLEKAKTAADERATSSLQEAEKARAVATAVEGVVQKLESATAGLRDRVEKLEKELSTRDQTLQNTASQLQGKVVEMATALGEIKTGFGEIKTLVTAQSTSVVAKLEELTRAKDQSSQLTAQIAGFEAKLKEKEALIQGLTLERDRQGEALRRRESNVQRLEKELEAERSRTKSALLAQPRVDEKPPPATPVVTRVEAVESKDGVVVLGAGKKNGLEPGHSLTISRDGKLVGRVRVLKVFEEMAGAEIVETQAGESIQRNDSASTGGIASPAAPILPAIPLTKSDPPPPPAPSPGSAGK